MTSQTGDFLSAAMATFAVFAAVEGAPLYGIFFLLLAILFVLLQFLFEWRDRKV